MIRKMDFTRFSGFSPENLTLWKRRGASQVQGINLGFPGRDCGARESLQPAKELPGRPHIPANLILQLDRAGEFPLIAQAMKKGYRHLARGLDLILIKQMGFDGK